MMKEKMGRRKKISFDGDEDGYAFYDEETNADLSVTFDNVNPKCISNFGFSRDDKEGMQSCILDLDKFEMEAKKELAQIINNIDQAVKEYEVIRTPNRIFDYLVYTKASNIDFHVKKLVGKADLLAEILDKHPHIFEDDMRKIQAMRQAEQHVPKEIKPRKRKTKLRRR